MGYVIKAKTSLTLQICLQTGFVTFPELHKHLDYLARVQDEQAIIEVSTLNA